MRRTNDAIPCVPRSRFGHKILIDLFTDTPIDFKLLRYFQRQLQLSVKRRQARCRGGLLGCFTHWLIYLALYRRQHKHHSIVDAITTRHSLYPLLHPFLTSSLCACVLCRVFTFPSFFPLFFFHPSPLWLSFEAGHAINCGELPVCPVHMASLVQSALFVIQFIACHFMVCTRNSGLFLINFCFVAVGTLS